MRLSSIKKKMFYSIAKILGPQRTAWIVYILLLKKQIETDKKYHFILLSRNIFSKDISELRKRINEFDFILVSNSIMESIQSAWIPSFAREQSYYYKLLPKESNEWRKCDVFCAKIISLLSQKVKINGVLSSNFDYWQDAGFRKACYNNSCHFMVLRRENEVTAGSIIKDLYSRYEGVEIGYTHLVMVFSEMCKDSMYNIQSDGIKFGNIVVTGPPRLDSVKDCEFSNNLGNSKRKIILYSYLNGDYGEGKKNFWKVIEILSNFTIKHRIKLLVKCKSNSDKNIIINGLKKRNYNLSNIEILTDITNIEAIEGALCAVSYGSTVLSELLTLPVYLIVPFIGVGQKELNDAILHDADQYSNSGVYKVKSYLELEVKLSLLYKNFSEYSFEQRDQLRDRYLSWDSNELSSKRVERAMIAHCK